MSDRKRNADDIKRSLDDRRYWRQARKEVDGIFYDTMEAQPIGYWCPARWGESDIILPHVSIERMVGSTFCIKN